MPATNTPRVYNTEVVYTLTAINCYLCGVLFGMEADYTQRRQQDRRNFYCPNGHDQHFLGKTDAELAREERDAAQALARRELNRRRIAENEAVSAHRSLAAQKGWNTRIRRRIAAGVCPCCNRSFTPLREHIATKHPDFAIPAED